MSLIDRPEARWIRAPFTQALHGYGRFGVEAGGSEIAPPWGEPAPALQPAGPRSAGRGVDGDLSDSLRRVRWSDSEAGMDSVSPLRAAVRPGSLPAQRVAATIGAETTTTADVIVADASSTREHPGAPVEPDADVLAGPRERAGLPSSDDGERVDLEGDERVMAVEGEGSDGRSRW